MNERHVQATLSFRVVGSFILVHSGAMALLWCCAVISFIFERQVQIEPFDNIASELYSSKWKWRVVVFHIKAAVVLARTCMFPMAPVALPTTM